MKKRNYKNNYRKNYKRAKIKRYQRENKPEFLIEVKMLTFKDLQKMDLIDSRTYRESVKRKISSDYQGGVSDE